MFLLAFRVNSAQLCSFLLRSVNSTPQPSWKASAVPQGSPCTTLLAQKSKIKALEKSVSGEPSPPGLQMAAFSCLHVAFSLHTCAWKERERIPGISSFSYKDIYSMGLGSHAYDLV